MSMVADHDVEEGSEAAARAEERAAVEEAGRGRDAGGSTDQEEEPSAEAERAEGSGGSTGSQAQGEATAGRQGGYLPVGTKVRIVGLTRSSQYNGKIGVVDYTPAISQRR